MHVKCNDGVTALVIGGQQLFLLGHHQRFALRPHHDFVFGVLELDLRNHALVASRRHQGRLVDQIHEIGTGKTRCAACRGLQVNIRRQRNLAHVHFQNLLAADHVRVGHDDLAVKAARAQQCRIEHIGTVRRGDEDDALVGLEPIHLDEELIEGLLAFVVAAAEPGAAVPAHCIDFVDEDDAGGVLLGLLEHVAHARGTHADEHLDEVRAGYGEERHVGLAGDRAREQGLAGSGWTNQQHAARNAPAKPLEFAGVAQELDDLL